MCVPAWLQVAAAVGEAASGLAATSLLILAIWKWNEWQEQRRSDVRNRAAQDIAARLLAACSSMELLLIAAWTAARMARDDADPVRRTMQFRSRVHQALEDARSIRDHLSFADRAAMIAFPAAGDLITDARACLLRIRATVRRLQVLARGSLGEGFTAKMDELEKHRPAVASIRDAAIQLLGPAARYERPPRSPGAAP